MGLKFYDFGSDVKNMEHYNQIEPPKYDLSKFNIPTYFYCGTRDDLVVGHDCKRQYRSIAKYNNNKIKFYKVSLNNALTIFNTYYN